MMGKKTTLSASTLIPAKLTKQDIENCVKKVEYQVFGGRLTICVMTLQNDYMVVGKDACVSEATFDAELGRNYAFDNALEKVWPLEGYRLRQRHYDADDAPYLT